MTKDEIKYVKFHAEFTRRILDALKPANKMWQRSHKKPLTWPDPITLIKWLTKEAA